MTPKYSLLEIERRWLIDEKQLPALQTLEKMVIIDHYIQSSRMRLRKMEMPNRTQYKLCKKYGKRNAISEPITNIYLTEQEYNLFVGLDAKKLIRERYAYIFREKKFNINVVLHGNGPIIVEAEYETEEKALLSTPPTFCTEEVSNNRAYESVLFGI